MFCGATQTVAYSDFPQAVSSANFLKGRQFGFAQNRDPALYRTIKQRFEPILQAKLEVDTTLGIYSGLGAIEAYLRGEG